MNSKEERKENTSYQAVGIVCPTIRDCKTIDGGQHVGIYTFERIGKTRLELLYLPEKNNCIANKKKVKDNILHKIMRSTKDRMSLIIRCY